MINYVGKGLSEEALTQGTVDFVSFPKTTYNCISLGMLHSYALIASTKTPLKLISMIFNH